MPGEFELIQRYFAGDRREDVLLGVGDDAAVVRPRGDLALAVDTLVAGVHFPLDAPPESIGHKALAVNLSDLAAMGAEPAWLLLALTLEQAREPWLAAFSRGLRELAAEHGMALIGGDVTRGPLTVSVQVGGYLPPGQALRRSGARVGDGVYVSGSLGDAALGLALWQAGAADGEAQQWLVQRLHRPTPRVALGRALLGLASAAIDLSDGLAADLGHLLSASGVGASVELERLPLSPAFKRCAVTATSWEAAVGGGDDYELCFTAPPAVEAELEQQARRLGIAITRIGRIEQEPGLRLLDGQGHPWRAKRAGYTHFDAEGQA